jgi:hypothetical protein
MKLDPSMAQVDTGMPCFHTITAYAHASFPSWVCGAYPLLNQFGATTIIIVIVFGLLGACCFQWLLYVFISGRTHMPLSPRGSVASILCSINMLLLLLLLSLLVWYLVCLGRLFVILVFYAIRAYAHASFPSCVCGAYPLLNQFAATPTIIVIVFGLLGD